jgi:hypothetical protein
VADAARPGRQEQRRAIAVEPEQRPAQRGGEALPNTTGGRDGLDGCGPFEVAAASAPHGTRWATEPDVGRVAHGVPAPLDGGDI